MVITVVGSIHMDFYIRLPKFPLPGETVLGRNFTMLPGGKGANQAVACSRLGVHTYIISRVGKDIFGEKLVENLKENRVNTKYVKVDENAHTGIAFILLNEKTGENIIAVAPGADYNVSRKDIDHSVSAIVSSDIVLLQLELPISTVIYAIKKAWEKQVKTILNPAPATCLPGEVYKYIYVLTPNRIEASLLSGINIETMEDAIKAGKILVAKGVKYVIITLGAKGSLIVSKNFIKHLPAYKVKVVDTTGAGDAFNAALAVGLAEGRNIVEACRMANAAAAIKVTKLGAQSGLPLRDELEEFMKKYSM